MAATAFSLHLSAPSNVSGSTRPSARPSTLKLLHTCTCGRFAKLGECALARRFVSAAEHDEAASSEECPGGLRADAAVSASHDSDTTTAYIQRQPPTVRHHDICSGALGRERHRCSGASTSDEREYPAHRNFAESICKITCDRSFAHSAFITRARLYLPLLNTRLLTTAAPRRWPEARSALSGACGVISLEGWRWCACRCCCSSCCGRCRRT